MEMNILATKTFLLIIMMSFDLLLQFHRVSHGQQEYMGNVTACFDSYLANGYSCSDVLSATTCLSFLTFRSAPPYNTAAAISDLLAAQPASDIASTNNITSITTKISSGNLVVVPVSCSCSGSISQHDAPYTVVGGDTYYLISNFTYQGLTTCRAIMSQNSYNPVDILIGSKILVPLRCACPSSNQTANGTSILVTYIVQEGDNLDKIGKTFGGVSVESIMEANMLSNTTIYASTPILVPLRLDICTEKPGSFYCRCPTSYLRVGSLGNYHCIKDRGKKFPIKLVASIGVGIGVGLSSLVLFGLMLYRYLKKKRSKALKKKMFEQNGGLILQQKLSSFGSTDKARIFTAEELERATENYSGSRVLGQGGYGMVYKAMLEDGTIVAVKRSKALDRERIEQFINEVVILSQINHRNIVNLLGCCLEMNVPILVYEYISNGTLSSHIHRDRESSLSWEDRFRVACEVAGAVAYMHSAASVPIFHRDIKPSNILLDDKFTAKVSDFGISRSVPPDKTHLTTAVQGTFGYLDPEYFQTSQFTEKSDVYSFGVVLVEILTGEKPVSFSASKDGGDQEGRNTVANFVSMMKGHRLLETLHPRVADEARHDEEVVAAVAMLALRCLRLNGRKRPSMKEVAVELEGLRNSPKSCFEIHGGELEEDDEGGGYNNAQVAEDDSSRSFSLDMESASIPR